ncbi:MAG: glucosaminidase domain-containing protein [Bacteroidales bacterium]|nr:glucosaminidase domain-containing protein [Bacteroidales bacterium]
MVRKQVFIIIIFAMSAIMSCRPLRQPVAPVSSPEAAAINYINTYRDLAISEMKRTGIPASITLAQGMVESDYGRSTLARTANNHFGIKCHNGWTGPTVRHHDDKRNDCFRKYRSPQESFYDHSDFLKTGVRYSSLFTLDPTDYKAWARGLKKAGYATDPRYDDLLIRKIEEYRLYEYDLGYVASSSKPDSLTAVKVPVSSGENEAIPPPAKKEEKAEEEMGTFGAVMARAPRIMERNRVQYIIVKEGETREKIESEFNLFRWELPRYNELNENFTLRPGQILYLEPKRDKAEPGKEYHYAADGETMYDISQQYAVKLKSLLEMNRMNEGDQPVKGQKIWLRETKPLNSQ